MTHPLVLVLCANERYFPGLYLSLATTLKNLDCEFSALIYIIDAGISEKSKENLNSLAARFGDHKISYILPRSERIESVRSGAHHISTYMRLELPELVDAEWILYIDADMLVLQDVCQLWRKVPSLSSELAGCQDWETKSLRQDMGGLVDKLHLESQHGYFNAGFLMMNLQSMRLASFSDRAISFLAEHGEYIRFADQTALNALAGKNWHKFDNRWNTPAWSYDASNDNQLPAVLHFTNHAPWLERRYTPSQFLFERMSKELGFELPDPETGVFRSSVNATLSWFLAPLRAAYQLYCALLAGIQRKKQAQDVSLRIARHWLAYFFGGPLRVMRYWKRIREINSPLFNPFL